MPALQTASRRATLRRMAGRDRDEGSGDEIELTCPECGAAVRMSEAKAEREMKARCPKSHEFAIAKALG